jgi:disulfide bond formation protein DsbB
LIDTDGNLMRLDSLQSIFSEVPLRAWFAALALGSLGVAAGGLELQALFRVAPCPFCIFQRLLYMVIGVLALGGVILPAAGMLWSGVIGLLALGGAAIAGYQSWMQAFPGLVNECGMSDPNAIERLVDWLGMAWPSLFLATGFCSSKEWVFLGLSIANWSFWLFAAIAAYALLLFKKS